MTRPTLTVVGKGDPDAEALERTEEACRLIREAVSQGGGLE